MVEGRSDVEALRSLGIEGSFVVARSSRKPIPDLVLDLQDSCDEVIVLVDFDAAGREQARRWAEELERAGLKANLAYWRCLKALVGSFTKDIEGLPSFMGTLKRRLGLI